MLTSDDVNWMKANHAEITENRTESITLHGTTETGTDPYTGEPITEPFTQTADVVWKEYSTVSNGDRSVVNGVELRQDDVKVTFDATVDLSAINKVVRNGINYTIVTVDEKGIGASNRQESLVRRVI